MQMALIIHELATNALKCGERSAPTGRVSIEGKTDGLDGRGTFKFLLKETEGPTMATFGSVVLLDSAKHFAQGVALDSCRKVCATSFSSR